MAYEKVPSCRVLVVCTDDLTSAGVKFMLQQPVKSTDDRIILDFVVRSVKTVDDAVVFLRKAACDVLVLRVFVRKGKAPQMVERILVSHPDTQIIVLADHLERDDIEVATRVGAKGYMQYAVEHDEFRDLVREIYHKTNPITYSGLAAKIMVKEASEAYQATPRPCRVTPREHKILYLIAHGKKTGQIARMLSISPRTVESHRKNLFKKMKVSTAPELVSKAYELDLLKRLDPGEG